MNSKIYHVFRNSSYALISNLITLFISIFVILIVPKIIGLQEFGYWQLYIFYSSYAGFLLLGWNDGIYLRYGGKFYNQLEKNVLSSQFYMALLLHIFYVFCVFFASQFIYDKHTAIIIRLVGISFFITNVSGMLLFTLQATNRVKEYANANMVSRMLYLFFLFVFLVVGERNYFFLIMADIIGKLGSFIMVIFYCKDIVFCKSSIFYFNFKEAYENISVGIKLMIANIASMLVIGIVRYGIERHWDVTTFGKVSLTLNIANFMMIFINAIGIIIFPILRRVNETKLPSIYLTMREFLNDFMLGILLLYYPFKVMLSMWIPTYADSLNYMAILFPMCVYEGKMALLINTYLKALRKEISLLLINGATVVLSVSVTLLNLILFENLDLAVTSIIFLLAFRCILAEVLVSRILNISILKETILETCMCIVFILTSWFISSWISFVLYGLTYTCYILLKQKDIKRTIVNFKLLLKN